MGRGRKYTPGALSKAVDAYFAAITRTVTVREQVNTGERDSRGHWVMETVEVKNDAGEPVRRVEYAVPPTVGGLCRRLGISRETWASYGRREAEPEYRAVYQRARERMEDYLEGELLTRPGKDLKGVVFSLQANYGYTERREVELGEKAAKAMTAQAIPASERAELLREIAREFGGPEHEESG